MVMLVKVNCGLCGYSWVPRIESPVVCPRCNSQFWNEKRRQERIVKLKEELQQLEGVKHV